MESVKVFAQHGMRFPLSKNGILRQLGSEGVLFMNGSECTKTKKIGGKVQRIIQLRAEALRLPEWMQQAERDAGRFHDGAPVVFFRRSREPWRVVMNLEDWIAIYTDYYRRKEGCNDTQEAKSPGCAADTVNEGESGRYCRNHL